MRSGQIELQKYVITKSLTKAPGDYPDAKNQPHVQARFVHTLFLLALICLGEPENNLYKIYIGFLRLL